MDFEITDFKTPIAVINTWALVFGLVGNVTACVVILCSRSMYSLTDFYLLNLSISDLLILILGVSFDMYLLFFAPSRSMGSYMYDSAAAFYAHVWMFETAVNVSILTVTIFTVERYLAICHPFSNRSMAETSRVGRIITKIWLAAVVLALLPVTDACFGEGLITLPKAVVDVWPYLLYLADIANFFLPVSLITVMYVLIGVRLKRNSNDKKQIQASQTDRSDSRALKMFAVIILVFVISWAPYYAYKLLWLSRNFISFDKVFHTAVVREVTYTLSSALNPVIYVMMSRKFRKAFQDLWSKFWKKVIKRTSNTDTNPHTRDEPLEIASQ